MFKNSFFHNRYFNYLLIMVTVIYAFIMIKLLFLRFRYSWDFYLYNLTPFETIKQYVYNRNHYNFDTWMKNLFGNIVLFIPLGFIIPLINKRFMRILLFLLVVLTILLIVELVQMLTRVGSFDIDDIILNSFGALIGFSITKVLVIFMNRSN